VVLLDLGRRVRVRRRLEPLVERPARAGVAQRVGVARGVRQRHDRRARELLERRALLAQHAAGVVGPVRQDDAGDVQRAAASRRDRGHRLVDQARPRARDDDQRSAQIAGQVAHGVAGRDRREQAARQRGHEHVARGDRAQAVEQDGGVDGRAGQLRGDER
jgi:hypothetical protein